MEPKRIAGIIFIVGIIVFGLYFLYLALPFLISLASNILYLGFLLIFVIVAIVAIFKATKWFFK